MYPYKKLKKQSNFYWNLIVLYLAKERDDVVLDIQDSKEKDVEVITSTSFMLRVWSVLIDLEI